ncbi:zinc metalloprotease [Gurleya vavrai]
MIDKTIILGNLLVTLLEILLNIRQIVALIRAKYDDKIQKIIKDEEEFEKIKNYNLEKLLFGNAKGIFHLCKLFYIIHCNLYYKTYQYVVATNNFKNEFHSQVLTSTIIMAVDRLFSIPFSIYSNFYIEQKYGFNKMTARLFISDYIKTELLIYFISTPIVYYMLKLISIFPSSFYMQLFLLIAAIQLILIVIFPVFIQPLFNKFEELKEGDLKVKIIELAKKIGFKPSKILTMDGSKRSHHSNAYFIGIFKEKRIVLFDTLLNQNTDNEILAILCHEFGHWYFSHTLKQISFAMINLFFYLYSFNYFINQETSISYYPMILKLLYFSMMLGFINPLLTLLTNSITRRYERQADVFAVKQGYGEDLKSGLIKLHVENKGNLFPDSWYSTYYHSHPTLNERIKLIDETMQKIE